MLIDGVWKVGYTGRYEESFSDMGDSDQRAIVVIQDGKLMGRDPHGAMYFGQYTLNDNRFHIILDVDAYRENAESAIPNLSLPYRLEFVGEINGADFFSGVAKVVGAEQEGLIASCERIF